MRVGLCGLGSIGRRHLGNLLALGAEVVAFDISPESVKAAQAEHPHARYVDALPFAGLDALVIATPIGNHLRWVEEAVARKLPFFVEKSIGALDQLPRWREIAAMDLPVNQVGYNLRFHPKLASLRAHVEGATAGQFFLDCDMSKWPGGSYGPMLLECSHEIDLALYCGAPDTIDQSESVDMEASFWLGPWYVVISGDVLQYHRQWTLTRKGAEASAFFYSPADLGVEMYHAEMAHFLECVREQKPTICPLADGLRVLEVCRQVEEMAGL